MTTYVLFMSTDPFITDIQFSPSWEPIAGKFDWSHVKQMNLGLTNCSNLLVLANGNGSVIGNIASGTIEIDAESFLSLLNKNILDFDSLNSIYISTQGQGIVGFASMIRNLARKNKKLRNTRIYTYNHPFQLEIPKPNDPRWHQFFSGF